MKKLILILAFAVSLTACKKNDPKPTPVTSNAPAPVADPKWNYSYDYKKTGDNTVYSGTECLTDTEMATRSSLIGAFNIQKWGRCN